MVDIKPPQRPKRTMDGFRMQVPLKNPNKPVPPKAIKPDLRPDHDLPAPKPTPLLAGIQDKLPAVALPSLKKQTGWKKWLFISLATLVVIVVALFVAAFVWYQGQLAPVSDDTTKHIRVTIESGSTPGMIAEQLEKAGVIRSSFAFTIYAKITGTENKLQAGAYTLQPSLGTPSIVDSLVGGKQITFKITFLPGNTLAKNRQALIDLGLFDTFAIDAALGKRYDRPLFESKPASADLEGYIYGETYHFDGSATPESILGQAFDQFEKVLAENDLVAKFKKRGFTLYEAITFASIVQREDSNVEHHKQIAAVFNNRMKEGMNLGSDVTYQYAADKAGVPRSPSLQSPYNTRIHAGLPPGPIAAPGVSALIATAEPAKNSYLFFLSGDDDQLYFAKTQEEHEQNVINHCQKKCQIL